MEKWLPVVGWEGYYEVSDFGNVRSCRTGKLLKQYNKRKYKAIELTLGKTKKLSVHRIVAMSFVPNPDHKPQVNHINGICNDNRACNLEWVTAKENTYHYMAMNGILPKDRRRKKDIPGYVRPGIKPVNYYSMDGHLIAQFSSIAEASKVTGYGTGTISHYARKNLVLTGGNYFKIPDLDTT